MKRKWFYKHRDTGTEGGGGGLSISDIIGGDGTVTPQNLTQQPATGTSAEGVNADGSVQEGYQKAADGTVTKTEAAPVEGTNADGTLQEGYKKDEQGNVVKDEDAEGDESGDEPGEAYWDAVEKITGRKIEVALPEGIVAGTPEAQSWLETPEGTVAILNSEREQSALAFEAALQQDDPRGYAYLLHRKAGLPDEDFFKPGSGFQLPSLEELQGSADHQSAIYKYDLINVRGLDEDAAQALVEKAIKDNKLKERSEAAWKGLDVAAKKQLDDLQKTIKDEDDAFTTAVGGLRTKVEKMIKSELGIVIPETLQPQFQQFVLNNFRWENGKFFLVQEVGQEPQDLRVMLESLFFQQQKGDLSKIVARKAKTVAAQNLRLRTGGSKHVPGAGTESGKNGAGFVPLSSLL